MWKLLALTVLIKVAFGLNLILCRSIQHMKICFTDLQLTGENDGLIGTKKLETYVKSVLTDKDNEAKVSKLPIEYNLKRGSEKKVCFPVFECDPEDRKFELKLSLFDGDKLTADDKLRDLFPFHCKSEISESHKWVRSGKCEGKHCDTYNITVTMDVPQKTMSYEACFEYLNVTSPSDGWGKIDPFLEVVHVDTEKKEHFEFKKGTVHKKTKTKSKSYQWQDEKKICFNGICHVKENGEAFHWVNSI